jgi:hypothetical protein
MRLIAFSLFIFAIVFSGCGNPYLTASPIPSETMTKIETVVDAILTDTLHEHQQLVNDVAKTIEEDVFVDGASAILGWRFKEGKYVTKMFPEYFPKKDLAYYNAASYEDKMEEFLVPGAKKCYKILSEAAQVSKNGGDL